MVAISKAVNELQFLKYSVHELFEKQNNESCKIDQLIKSNMTGIIFAIRVVSVFWN